MKTCNPALGSGHLPPPLSLLRRRRTFPSDITAHKFAPPGFPEKCQLSVMPMGCVNCLVLIMRVNCSTFIFPKFMIDRNIFCQYAAATSPRNARMYVRTCTMDGDLEHYYIGQPIGFYSASALLAMQTAVLAIGISSFCLSVRPSHSGIVSRRMKIRWCGLQFLVGQYL